MDSWRHDPAAPPAARRYFDAELDAVGEYLTTVPSTLEPADCDAAFGPVAALPWLYVADLTGWRGTALARLLAADRDGPCHELRPADGDSVERLWSVLDASDGVLHVPLSGDGGPLLGALQTAALRGFSLDVDERTVEGSLADLPVVFADTRPSKRLDSPLPEPTTPLAGAVLSYAPRASMLPDQPDGTTRLPDPPALDDRADALETLLLECLAAGDDAGRERFVDAAVETLSITHSVVGERDLLFDVSPRVALKYGGLLDRMPADDAVDRMRRDVLAQVPQTPGSESVRETLGDLLP